jgi:hypothetical protein
MAWQLMMSAALSRTLLLPDVKARRVSRAALLQSRARNCSPWYQARCRAWLWRYLASTDGLRSELRTVDCEVSEGVLLLSCVVVKVGDGDGDGEFVGVGASECTHGQDEACNDVCGKVLAWARMDWEGGRENGNRIRQKRIFLLSGKYGWC